jgi:arylsulfatase A-like enzyme
MRSKKLVSSLALACAMACAANTALAQTMTAAPLTVPTAQNAPTMQRPNVLIWMIDDLGFAQLACFGGLIATPNIDRVANMGLRYTNYHTPAICSSSRAAILTGRNPHSVHMGGHALGLRPYPGYDADIPPAAGTIAENLDQAGYSTFALGKWDHVRSTELSTSGPYHHWPLGQGFDRFYGFLWADTDNWHPPLVQDNTPIPTPTTPGYHLNQDMADHAISMIASRDANADAAPFFMYWATGTAHAPHHAPQEWIDRYKGKFDMGWDVARERILKVQIAKGIVPAGTKLSPRHPEIPAWSGLGAEDRRLFARQMEVFAASVSYADFEFGRILDALQASGELDNTMVIITSDNGASGEGGVSGTFNENTTGQGYAVSVAENMKFYNRWGGPETYPHYAAGWAMAGNTPNRFFKQSTHEGGTRVPFVVAWPKGIAARGEIRKQFAYVTDVAATILDAAKVPLAKIVNNVPQMPMEGHSLVASFAKASDTSGARAQYGEMIGNKALWDTDGWGITTSHRTTPWAPPGPVEASEPWELYNLNVDQGQTRDLSAQQPDRLAALAKEFEAQAARYNVNPIASPHEGMLGQLIQADFARRGGIWNFPQPATQLLGTGAPPVYNRSYHMTANVTLAAAGGTGPVFASGGPLGGVGLYLKDGRPVFVMHSIMSETEEVQASDPLPVGTTKLELVFVRGTPAGMKPTDMSVTIKANGQTIAERKLSFALNAPVAGTMSIGSDDGDTISRDYKPSTQFPGKLEDVRFDFNF